MASHRSRRDQKSIHNQPHEHAADNAADAGAPDDAATPAAAAAAAAATRSYHSYRHTRGQNQNKYIIGIYFRTRFFSVFSSFFMYCTKRTRRAFLRDEKRRSGHLRFFF